MRQRSTPKLMLWLLLPLVAYLLYLWTITAFASKKEPLPSTDIGDTPIRVLVPMRNEASRIRDCLDSLSHQELWPNADVNLIVIDDHSTDDSVALAELALAHYSFPASLYRLPIDLHGKKAALAYAIERQPKNSIILTTDADCTHTRQWIKQLTLAFQDHVQVVCAPVQLTGKGVFAQWQGLEFSGLIALTAGHIRMGYPSLANGANLGFRKSAYEEVEGYAAKREFASGDDMLLLHKIVGRFGASSIRFEDNSKALVRTPAERTLTAFWHQRLRWVSKAGAYTSLPTQLSQGLGWFGSALPVAYTVLGPLLCWPVHWVGVAWALKVLAELPLLILGALRYGQAIALLWLPILQPIQALYTVIIGPVGLLSKHYYWKGRRAR